MQKRKQAGRFAHKFHLPDNSNEAIIRFAQSGRGAVRLARLHGVQEVGGSNPLAPTAIKRTVLSTGRFYLLQQNDSYITPMNSNEEIITPSVNKQSILSLVFGILTILSFCTGWLPVPFIGILCFPTSLLLGILAFIFGAFSLNRIREHNESGRPMAWIGIMIGGFVFVCVLCMIISIISLFMFAPNSIYMPPFIQNLQT